MHLANPFDGLRGRLERGVAFSYIRYVDHSMFRRSAVWAFEPFGQLEWTDPSVLYF